MNFTCKNIACKHCYDKKCTATPEINERGQCVSFEKGFTYHILKVSDALGSSNFIDMVTIQTEGYDLRLGMYYVSLIWGLTMKESEWGLSRLVTFHKEKGNKALSFDEILKMPFDVDKLNGLMTDYNAGRLPGKEAEEKANNDDVAEDAVKTVSSQPYGWLSPGGKFTERDFGEHEAAAQEIAEERGWTEEYYKWYVLPENAGKMCRDFLCEVKGYCLIHNPSGYGGYIVTHIKDLTRKQRDFLFDYFIALGDTFKASLYVSDDD